MTDISQTADVTFLSLHKGLKNMDEYVDFAGLLTWKT